MTGESRGGKDWEEVIYEAKSVFSRVKNIPYVLGLDGNPKKLLVENKGNCTRKHLYLAAKLLPLGYKVSLGIATFNWRELPIPEEITALLKDPIDSHLFLYASLGGNESVVDATWDECMPEGFTRDYWDGENSTEIGVSVKNLYRQDLKAFQARLLLGKSLSIVRKSFGVQRVTPFNDAFNRWLGRSK
ncbi:MAG TPA: hypothetical protein VI819_03300 [Patescibacteria group bacterium]|nr:hypothetical protein [Patescibacteria group bacterium]